MKTTIDIADPLLAQARRVAAQEGTTVKALVETGLRRVLEERERQAEFRLRRASFKGRGLQPSAEGLSWDRLREMAYEGRGD
ncbi:MAG TPA: type II toxin-antitoxin system VapB family antitoxin [Burkholderiaceae bacterium]|nr:type II toxin-antitoxin system VapB family antitoxin [Burkholderiaceae bacterium]